MEITRQEICDFFNGVASDVVANVEKKWKLAPEVVEHVSKLLDYTLLSGKLEQTGLLNSIVKSLISSLYGENATYSEDLKKDVLYGAAILEWLHAGSLLIDDVLDKSQTRGGKPCWYRMPGIGMTAINDGLLMISQAQSIMSRHFSKRTCYVALIDLVAESVYGSELGQQLDLVPVDFSLLDGGLPTALFIEGLANRYRDMTYLKTTYCSYSAVCALAMIIVGNYSPEAHAQALVVLRQIGHYYQVLNDVLDVFGNANAIGKHGTDIEMGKCAWPIITALTYANDTQRAQLAASYGRPEPEHVVCVCAIMKDVGVLEHFARFESEILDETKRLIEDLDCAHPISKNVYTGFLRQFPKLPKMMCVVSNSN